jgi:photosystem II stability/assembly factor-like uncharacterized protein
MTKTSSQLARAVATAVQSIFGICCVLAALASAQDVTSLYSDMHWRMIGPFRGGRTVAGAGIPSQPCVFFIGVNNGGVWKTNDCGNTWQPVFEGLTQSIGALAVAPSNPDVLYVGSGEGLRRPDLSIGDGVYKSTDGGKSWTHLGLRDGEQIGSILVDPKNPDRLFVAVLGHPYGPNAERGIFRSMDGGQSFTNVLFKSDDVGGIDLAFDPRNSNKIYASLWASRRPPWTVGGNYEGSGSGLFKSEDGGGNWRELNKGFPAKHGRISIAIAPSDPDRIYSTVDVNDAGGVYRSDDAGENWALVNDEERVSGRNSDFAFIRVHPKDRDTIFLSNTSTYKSTDGGKNFTAIKGAPGGDDYHSTWINPNNPDIMLLTSDQGAVVTVNGGETWSSWYNQPTAQIYHVATDSQFPYWVYGSQQESGSVGTTSRSDYGAITFRDWHPIGIEEYGYVAPDPLHPDILYGGKFTKFDRRTGQIQDVSPWVIRTGKYRLNRSQPVMFSPVDPHVLYFASNVLFKTVNGGHSWEEISPDLTRPDPGVPASLGMFVDDDPWKGKHRGVIYSLAPSPKDVNLIWAGTDDGLVHVTRDGGKTWKDVSPPELTPWSKISQIDAGHFDAQTAYVSVNRFRLDDLHAYIYRTHDGGKSWKKITSGISDDAAVNAVREDPKRAGLLFASTERAMWVSFDDGDHWHSLQLNLPFTSMRDFVIHGDDVVVGTHGRSFWILDDITPLRQIHEGDAAATKLFQPQGATRIQRSTNPDTPLPPETPMGQNPPDGAVLDYLLKDPAKLVTLEILDASGKLVRRYGSDDTAEPFDAKAINVPTYWVREEKILPATAGMHRWVWDLRYPKPKSAESDYPISAIPHDTPAGPLGPAVVPGEYTLRLTVDGATQTQKLKVRMDPRVPATAADLQSMLVAERRAAADVSASFEALQQVRALRKQLKSLKESGPEAIREAASQTEELLGKLETGTAGKTPAPGLSSARGLAAIHSWLSQVYGTLDSADAAPTVQALAMLGELEKASAQKINGLKEIQASLAELNRKLREAGAREISQEYQLELRLVQGAERSEE